MALLEVLHFPDARLRQKAEPIPSVDDTIKQLAGDMLETMYHENGIGLAAIQINQPVRLVVTDLSETRDQPLILINPQITAKQGLEVTREGCLSVPDYFDTVQRAEHIQFSYTDLQGDTIETEGEGLLAVCIQHEIDHLDGKLFIDYLSPLKQRRIKKRFKKQAYA